ncbi:MAG TPA: sulfite exporter TauE/SafE family protein [Gaiellaceae bacterium]|nr:sulfite exporter TauE/SafE family protein [Gaiellaceae bacterium]
MSASTIVLAIVLGITAGVLAGMFGVGGGVLFVPTLVALGLGQLEAQGTSLLAILPTVLVGAWNQRRYGNLRVRTALVVGVSSVVGVEVGARLVTQLPEATLRRLFAILLFAVAVQLVWRTRRRAARYPDSP